MVERDTHYDSVVIGASPTGLFEAAALAETGAKVLVVDQSDRLGGAWTTLDLPGVGTVECGSHYLIDLPNVYSFLEEVLDIRLVLLDPPPQYILPRRVASRLCVDFTQRWGGKISPRVHRGEVWQVRITVMFVIFSGWMVRRGGRSNILSGEHQPWSVRLNVLSSRVASILNSANGWKILICQFWKRPSGAALATV